MHKVRTRYYVTDNPKSGSYFSPSGYTKYGDGQNYGLHEAIEHANEIRNHIYNGDLIYADTDLFIVTETTVQTCEPINPLVLKPVDKIQFYYDRFIFHAPKYRAERLTDYCNSCPLSNADRLKLLAKIELFYIPLAKESS